MMKPLIVMGNHVTNFKLKTTMHTIAAKLILAS